MAEKAEATQATSTIDYENLLEEIRKLDIADLLLIHRRIIVRWTSKWIDQLLDNETLKEQIL